MTSVPSGCACLASVALNQGERWCLGSLLSHEWTSEIFFPGFPASFSTHEKQTSLSPSPLTPPDLRVESSTLNLKRREIGNLRENVNRLYAPFILLKIHTVLALDPGQCPVVLLPSSADTEIAALTLALLSSHKAPNCGRPCISIVSRDKQA